MMVTKKQRKAIVIGIVIVLLFFLLKFNLGPLSILELEFQYSKDTTLNNYPAIAKSTHQFGDFEDKKDNTIYSTYYNRVTPNSLEIYRARNEVGGYAEHIQTYIVTTDLKLNPETLDKLEFNFYGKSSVQVGGLRTLQGGYIGVYLVGKEDIPLIRSENVYYPDHPNYEENGKVTLTKQNGEFVLNRRGSEDIINIPNGEYELAIYVYATQNIDWVGSERHNLQVTGLYIVKEVVQKEIYYGFSDNKCSEIMIYPSEKTINDYDTLEECEENIVKPLNPIWIVLGLLAFVGVLGYIYWRLRK